MANERFQRDEEWGRRDRALLTLGAILAMELRGYVVKDGASPNRAVELLRQCCNKWRGSEHARAISGEAAEQILQVVLDSIERDGP